MICRLQWVNPFFIPPLSEVGKTAWKLILSGALPEHALISLGRAVGGFLAAALVGVPLGVWLGTWLDDFKLALNPLLEVGSQINPFIMFHVIVLFLGIGEITKVIVIAWTCIWPILFSVISGIRNIDPLIVKSARAFGISRRTLLYKVIMPAAGPTIFTGLRIGAGYSFLMLIAAEMMGCSSGLGWFIAYNQENYHVPDLFATAGVIALLGLSLDALMHGVEKKVIVTAESDSPNIMATRLSRQTADKG